MRHDQDAFTGPRAATVLINRDSCACASGAKETPLPGGIDKVTHLHGNEVGGGCQGMISLAHPPGV